MSRIYAICVFIEDLLIIFYLSATKYQEWIVNTSTLNDCCSLQGKFIVQCGLLSPAKDVIGIEINADRVEEANIKMKETFIAHYTLYNEQKMHSQEQGPTEKSALAGAQSPQSQKIKQETSSSSLLPFTGTKSQSTSTPTYTATPIAAALSPAVQTAYETFSARCRMVACNALDYDYSQVTCMFLYLIPRGLRIFLPYIQKQKQTIKIISFQNQLVPGLKEQSTSGDDDDSRGENGENEKDAAKCDSSSSGNGDDDDDERDGSFAKIVLVKKYYITTAALPDIRYPMYYYLVNP